ncbi:MAG: hypothetical protein WAU89_23270 [Candidatus Acidiferrales bacterium]
MDVESKETIDAAIAKLQTVGETLIASFFGNLTKFVDETLPKIDILLTNKINLLDQSISDQIRKVHVKIGD